MKRIICIILSLALLISLFTVTALADSSLSSTAKTLNLLDFIPEFLFVNDYYTYPSVTPSFIHSPKMGYEIDFFEIKFSADHGTVPPLYYSTINLVFSTTYVQPEMEWFIILNYRDELGNQRGLYADFIDVFENGEEVIWYFYFDVHQELLFLDNLYFELGEASDNFTFTLLDFSSTLGSRSVALSTADLKIEGTVQAEGEGYYNQVFYDGTQNFPDVQYDVSFTKPAGPADDYLTAYLDLFAPIGHADRLVLTFISTGVYDNYYDHTQLTTGGLFYENHYDTCFDANLPIQAYYSHMDSSWEGMDLWRVTIVCDISGLDLNSGKLVFSTSFNDTVSVPSMPNKRDYFIRFESVLFYLDSPSNVPWYRQFYNWIADNLWYINASIESAASRIEYKLDQLIGAGDPPIDLRDQEHQIQDIVTDMDDLGNRLEQSGNELESLMPSMPTWEETGLSNLVIDYSANINAILMVFNAIYENRIITQILTFTFLFALGGFILFGER